MDTSDMRKGLKIMLDGQPYVVIEFQFVKPGKGQAFTRTKLKNLLTGSNIERNIRSSEKFEAADVEERTMQYIYPEGDMFVFMNSQSGEQVSVHKDAVGRRRRFSDRRHRVRDHASTTATRSASRLPPHVVVQVLETEPGMRGDTATNVTKPAKISTGATVQVPLFIDRGRVDQGRHAHAELPRARPRLRLY